MINRKYTNCVEGTNETTKHFAFQSNQEKLNSREKSLSQQTSNKKKHNEKLYGKTPFHKFQLTEADDIKRNIIKNSAAYLIFCYCTFTSNKTLSL